MSAFGAMRHRLALEQPVETPDGAGGVSRSFAAVATVFAAIEPVAASSSVIADRSGQRITHRIRIRHRAGVTAAHRLTFGSRIFAIRGIVDEGEAGRYLVLAVEEQRP